MAVKDSRIRHNLISSLAYQVVLISLSFLLPRLYLENFGSEVNGVLSTAVKIINGFISAINFAIDIINAIPGVNISRLDKLNVTKLAKGAVIDRVGNYLLYGYENVQTIKIGNCTKWMLKMHFFKEH